MQYFKQTKVAKLILFSVCYSFLLIFALASTTESVRVVFRRDQTQTRIQPDQSNIVTVPMIYCRKGYHLDHRKKCRKIMVNSWFE